MLKGINPGKLDIKLTVEQKSKSTNSIGEIETAWTSYKTMWAARNWKPANEKVEAKQVMNDDTGEFIARYDSGLTTEMRFKQNAETTYFYITDVRSDKRLGTSIIVASRRDNQ